MRHSHSLMRSYAGCFSSSFRNVLDAVAIIIMLFVCPCSASADIWDYSQGTVFTDWSSTKSDIRNMFGGSFGPAFGCGCEGANMLFADNMPAGTVHYVEWQTPDPVTVRSISLKANHDGLPADAKLRGFSCFRLFAADPETGEFDMKLYEILPTDPYGNTPEPEYTYLDRNPGFAHPSMSLALTANVLATTAQRFRAEFVQFGPKNSYASGPRIIELDGFGTYYAGRPYPVPEPSTIILLVVGSLIIVFYMKMKGEETMSKKSYLAFLVVLVCANHVAAMSVAPGNEDRIIAQTGFNDASGISSDVLLDSPYTIGETIRDRGEGESGWANLWTLSAGGSIGGSPSRAVVSDVLPLEGDGCLFIQENDPQEPTWVHRSLAERQYFPFIIEQYVRFPAGGGVASRPGQGGTGSLIGPQWSASNGVFYVYDGDGAGDSTKLNTGFTWQPMQWYKVSLRVDPITQTYDFYVDDQKYNAPDSLGFRGTIPSVYFIEYLTDKAVWIDRLSIAQVPEPSIFVLCGGIGIAMLVGAKRRIANNH